MEKPGMGGVPLLGAGLLILWGLAASFSLPAQSREPPRSYWRDPPAALTVGREARLSLCLNGGGGAEIPAPPPVPPMAIMETLLPEGDEILALRVIPLEGPVFVLPGFSFSLGARTLQAPPLNIPVNPAPREEDAGTGEAPGPAGAGFGEGTLEPVPPWPGGSGMSGAIWNRRIEERSRALWEEGQVVEALAALRRRERDHIAGFTLAALRRELERALRLEEEGDEIFRHPLFLIPLSALCLILAALGLTVPRRLWRERGFAVRACGGASLAFSVLALLCLLRLTTASPLKGILPAYLRGKNPRQALAQGAPMYRAPEEGAAETLSLKQGQGLLVFEIRDGWAYAESLRDGVTGWIKAGTYLIY